MNKEIEKLLKNINRYFKKYEMDFYNVGRIYKNNYFERKIYHLKYKYYLLYKKLNKLKNFENILNITIKELSEAKNTVQDLEKKLRIEDKLIGYENRVKQLNIQIEKITKEKGEIQTAIDDINFLKQQYLIPYKESTKKIAKKISKETYNDFKKRMLIITPLIKLEKITEFVNFINNNMSDGIKLVIMLEYLSDKGIYNLEKNMEKLLNIKTEEVNKFRKLIVYFTIFDNEYSNYIENKNAKVASIGTYYNALINGKKK